MKHDLKISRLAVICVLCATVSGAYGASSVRSLGGSGTYTSAAAAAADGNSGGASSVRGGSLRVSPSSNVSGTTTSISTDNTTSGRVATSPRLSIGHYLTGGTSVSGGSSIRPIVPGGSSTSGGGSSSGGDGGDVDLSGVNQRLDALESDVDSLFDSRDSIDESITDLWSGKQDILTANDGLIEIDSDNVIYINTENLADAMKDAGFSADVDFRVNEGYIEYWDGTTWAQLIALDDLRGPQGEPGESVAVDDVINGIEDDLQAAVNAAVADAVQTAVADEIANADLVTNTELKTALGGYATDEDLESGLNAKANAADVYTKAEVYNKTEVDTKISDATSDIVGSAEIEQFKTDVANLKTTVGDANSGLVKSVNDLSGDVTALDGEMDTVSQLAGSAAATAATAASDAASALSGLDNKADKSELANYVTNDALTQKGYVTSNEVSGQIATATANMVTDDDLTDALANKADKATTLAGYGITDTYTTAQIDEKLEDVAVGGIEGMEQVLAGKQDVANLVQVVSEADTTKYPSGAAVYKELETKANASDLDTLEQTVGQLDSTINAEGTGLADRIDAANDAASAAQTAAEEAAQTAESVQASLALKQDVSAREATTITNDETKYPSSAAVTAALAGKADVSALDDYVTNDGLGDALATAGAVTDSNMSEKLADYATKSDLSGYATTDALNAKADKATTLAGYGITDTYTTAQIDEKLQAISVGGMEGMEEILAGKQDKNIPGATNHVVVTDASGNITTTATIGIDKVTDLQTSLDAKADAATVDGLTESVGDLQTTIKGEDGTSGLVQQISELTTNVTNVTENVTNITEQVSEITNPDTGVQSQITNITNIIGNGESGLVADVADAKAAAEKASQDVAGKQDALTAEQLNAVNSGITAEKVSVYDGYADTIAGKQEALGYTAENAANRAGSITAENQSSATAYPSVGAITQWTNDRINELSDTGIPVNPDNIGAGAINTEKIANGAITKPKLHQDLQDEIEGKEDKANLKALAYKEQIKDADVADDAAISKSKLATDVQSALDNAANAVAAPAGEKPANSVLGTDGDGNPVWYEIVTD
jgi:hypothetical protein